ncbi:hypothetical protein [Haloarchaeobius sp. FL176]|uniref:hypothetical protein n=1 Tax=Haloarchaeobius sp. FL176 TaxID=2967129 RepID=UPI002148C5BC|nr:hypothetical protein [Haloarchaeobius sp. FL176]
MKRRHLLGACAGVTSLLGGCVSRVQVPTDDDPDRRRSNRVNRGDLVRPEDDSLRRVSDLPLASLKRAPAPPEGEPQPAESPSNGGELTVTDEYWRNRTHVSAYSIDGVEVEVYPDQPVSDSDVGKLYVALMEYPRQQVIAEGISERFQRSQRRQSITVDFDLSTAPRNDRLQYVVFLLPGDADIESVDPSRAEFVMETDPFVVYSGEKRIRRAPSGEEPGETTSSRYSRTPIEGAYLLRIGGRTAGRDWDLNLLVFKSAHEQSWRRPRGRARHEYVTVELVNGTANELATILYEEAESNGAASENGRVEFAVDVVQSLPYASDSVTAGFDDYTKFILETLVDGGNDCEDTAILLASVLETPVFNNDAVLIQPPGHMAVGIWGPELEGYKYHHEGRRYTYIETTNPGWSIGDAPEAYQGERADIHQV